MHAHTRTHTHTHTHSITGISLWCHASTLPQQAFDPFPLASVHSCLMRSRWRLLCVQIFVWEYVNMECIIVTVDLGDWPLRKKQTILVPHFFVLSCSPRTKAEIGESAQNNPADKSWGRLPGVSSLPTVNEGIPRACILFLFPQFPRCIRHVSACLDTKLYLISPNT